MLASILPIIQIILSVLLVGAILLQQSDAGLGGAFGGGASASNPFRTKRGAEKIMFIGTIVIAVLFLVATLLSSYIQLH